MLSLDDDLPYIAHDFGDYPLFGETQFKHNYSEPSGGKLRSEMARHQTEKWSILRKWLSHD